MVDERQNYIDLNYVKVLGRRALYDKQFLKDKKVTTTSHLLLNFYKLLEKLKSRICVVT